LQQIVTKTRVGYNDDACNLIMIHHKTNHWLS